MSHIKYILPSIVICFFCQFLKAQVRIKSASDSSLQRTNNYLKKGLELTDLQATKLLVLQKFYASSIDAIQKGDTSKRTVHLGNLNVQFKRKLQDLFTKQQMERYKALEKAKKEALSSRIVAKPPVQNK